MKKKKTASPKLFLLLLGIAALFSGGCARVSAGKFAEAKRKDLISREFAAKQIQEKPAPLIQSIELFSFIEKPLIFAGKSLTEKAVTSFDNSSISTMFDGFGNKTEIRTLAGDSFLHCIISKTSANGEKRVLVFGKNGEVKMLQGEIAERALTAKSSLIADTVGIIASANVPRLPKIEEPPVEIPESQPTVLNAAATVLAEQSPNSETAEKVAENQTPDSLEIAKTSIQNPVSEAVKEETAANKNQFVSIKLQYVDIKSVKHAKPLE